MQQVVLYNKVLHDRDLPVIVHLLELLEQKGVNVFVFRPLYEQLAKKAVRFGRLVGFFDGYADFKLRKIDFVITLGGDGTILDVVTHVRDSEVPILGINLGRLGFLAHISKNRLEEAIEALLKGMYNTESRTLIHLESSHPIFGETCFALNDFTLLKRDTSSMITIKVFLNGEHLNTYWADGIIVATPTGSTGYSLSCGGPIVFPNSNVFVITPVAPHNLNVRPLIVSDASVITFGVEGRADNFLCTLDSRSEIITQDFELSISRASFKVQIVHLYGENFLRAIRDKLGWGNDNRN